LQALWIRRERKMEKAPEVMIEWEKGEIAKLHLEEGDAVVVESLRG